jgi:hypothetical protein
MRRFLPLALLLLAASVFAQGKGGLSVGADVPGTFHPYNVTARVDPTPEPEKATKEPRSTKHKYHCLITDYDMDPVVMLVARNLDDSAGFRDLLQKLNSLVETNQRLRLRAFVVALYDDLTDVVTQDDKRDELAGRLERLAGDLKLTGVVVALAAPKDLAKFKLDETAALNALVYHKLKITAARNFNRDVLDKADGPEAKALLGDVSALVEKLNPKPKK